MRSTGAGNAIGGGYVAVGLGFADPRTIAEAVDHRPWRDAALRVRRGRSSADLIAYIDWLRAEPTPGGAPIGGTGPVAEGFIAVAIGLPLLLLVTLFVARHRRRRATAVARRRRRPSTTRQRLAHRATAPASPVGPITARRERRGERMVLASFGVTMLTGPAARSSTRMGGQTQLEGILLALCLGGLGVGIVLWAQELMSGELAHRGAAPDGQRPGGGPPRVEDALTDEERLHAPTGAPARAARRARRARRRRSPIPVLSLGPAPGRSLFETPWKLGLRLVDGDGRPVRADATSRRTASLTVFPEGFVGNAEAQTLLIHAGADRLQLAPARLLSRA